LLFNSRVKVASKFSCFVSLGILTFLVIFFAQSDVFLKERPIVSTQSISTNARPNLDFDYDNMAFAFGITDSDNVFHTDNSYFNMTVQNFYYNSTGELLGNDFKTMELCNPLNFKTRIEKFEMLDLQNAYCPTTGNFTVGGYWDEATTRYIQIAIWPCNNDTYNNSCKSVDEIHSYFSDKYISIYFTDTIIDANNYENPIQSTYSTVFTVLDPNIIKKTTMTFKKVIMQSDDGLIFESDKTTNSFMLGDQNLDVMSDNWDSLGSYLIYSSSEIYVVTRRYQRLQEAIANLGGLANSLIWIGYFLTYLEKEFIVFSQIMNKLYIFSEQTARKNKTSFVKTVASHWKKISLSKIKVPEGNLNKEIDEKNNLKWAKNFIAPINPPNDDFVLEHFSQENEKQEEKPPVKKFARQTFSTSKSMVKIKNFLSITNNKTKEISMNFIEFVKIKSGINCIRLNKKEKLLKEALKIYRREIDITDLIQRVHDIDRLKLLLLNPEQCQLFNLIAKPLIHINDKKDCMDACQDEHELSNNMNIALKLKQSREIVTLENLQNYYIKVKKDGANASQIDQRLINMIDLKIDQ